MSEVIEGKPQLPPGICFICELSNPVRYVDTLRDFEAVVRDKLDGRKYICEECVKDAAKKLGFPSPETYAELQRLAQGFVDDLEKARKELEVFKQTKELVDAVKALAPKPAPKPKAPATA